MRIANLPWYDFEELFEATDAFWQGIRRHLAASLSGSPGPSEAIDDLPHELDRVTHHVVQWRQPELLLSQACAYDVLYDAAADLTVVATPRFTADGCEGACYRSAVVAREADRIDRLEQLRGRVCVVNEPSSHSGTNALRPLVAPLSRDGRFFDAVLVSGDHVTSLEMVGDGRADVACIDVVALELCRRVRPRTLAGLRVLSRTAPAPAPPYVTSAHTPPAVVAALRRALSAAMADASLAPVRAALMIGGIEILPIETYRSLTDFEAPALARGYFELPAPARSPLHADPARTAPPALRPRSRCASR